MKTSLFRLALVAIALLGCVTNAQDQESEIEELSKAEVARSPSSDASVNLFDAMIGVPLPDNINFVRGHGGIPAYEIFKGKSAGKAFNRVFDDDFFDKFLLVEGTVKPSTGANGYLFSITDPTQTKTLFGIKFSKSETSVHMLDHSGEPASLKFETGLPEGKWTNFALSVTDTDIILYIGNMYKPQTIDLDENDIKPLEFPKDAFVFLASSGPNDEQFEGIIDGITFRSTSSILTGVRSFFRATGSFDPDEEGSGSGDDTDVDTESKSEVVPGGSDDEDSMVCPLCFGVKCVTDRFVDIF